LVNFWEVKMDKIFLRTPYNYDTNAASDAAGLKCEDETLAQQQFAEESDINTIVERFGLTGELPPARTVPQYGDFTGVIDYHSALNSVIAAQQAFNGLPAQMRARFENDPAQLLAFLGDEANRDEAVSLGLVAASEQAVQAVQESPKAPE
jgi:phage internal scaffolding protein